MFRSGLILAMLAVLFLPAIASPPRPEPAAEPNSEIPGTVTLSLDRFLALTRQMGKKTPAATSSGETSPVAYLFNQGQFRLTVQDRWVRVEGDLNLQVYGSGWVDVPLLPEGVVLQEARLDGSPLLVRIKDAQSCALLTGVGTHRLSLTYYLPLTTGGPTRSFAFQSPASAVTNLRLVLPGKDINVTSQPKIPLENRVKGDQTVVEGALPASGEGSQVTFSWIPLAAHPALRGKPTQEKPRIYARLYTLAVVSERDVRCQSRLDLSVLRNELKELTLDLPPKVEVLDVQGPKIAGWAAQDGKVAIHFADGVCGDQSFKVIYEQPLDSEPKGHFAVPTLQVEGAERIKGSVGISATGGVEVVHGGLQDARPIDIQELPAEVTEMTAAPMTLAYEYHKQPFQISLETHKGEEIALLPAVVDRAEALTLITSEGKLISSFTYTMRNNRKQYLQLLLPPKATLYSAFVEGKAVKPVDGAPLPGKGDTKGAIRLPLVSPAGTFPVEVTYVQDLALAGTVGSDALVAPTIDVPVCGLSWSVYLPDDHLIFSTEGSAQRGPLSTVTTSSAPVAAPAAPSAGGAVGIARAQQPPAAEKKVSVEEGLLKDTDQLEAAAGQSVNKEAYFRDDNRLAQMVQTASQGAFPVRVDIPHAGQLLQFSQLIVTPEEAPTVILHYYSKSLSWLVWWGVLAMGTALGTFFARGRSGWKAVLVGLAGLAWGSALLGPAKSAAQLALAITLLVWLRRRWGAYLIDTWKLRKASLTLLAVMAALSTAHADPGGGTVNIPLAEFMKLMDKAPQAISGSQSKAPAPWLLSRGDYRVNAGSGSWAEVEGHLTLNILQSGWQEVDLLPAQVVLKQVSLDSKPVSVYLKEGRYRCLAKGRGNHQLLVAFHLPVSERSLSLSIPPTRVSTLRLVTPAGTRVHASPDTPLTSRNADGKTISEGALLSASPTTLSWSPLKGDNARGKGGKPLLAARLFSLATVSDNVIRTKHRVDFQILRNELDTLTFTLPAGSEVVDLTCPNLAGWTTSDEGKLRRVTAALSQPAIGSLSVNLTVETPLAQIDSTWEIPALGVEGVERIKGSLGIEAGGGIEVTPVTAGLEAARPIDVQELPAEVTQMDAKPAVLAYEYHRQPYHISVETHKGKEVSVLTATIDKGQGTTLVTPEGKMVTRLVYTVRNNHQQHLEVEMPTGASLWSTFVNGKAVKPVKAQEGVVRIPLETSTSNEGQMSTFPIEITYAQVTRRPTWMEKVDLVTPKVDMPISDLSWTLYLPGDWDVLHQDGTLKSTTSAPSAVVSNPVPPPARRGQGAPVTTPPDKGQAQAGLAANNLVRESDQGVLPVQVSLPLVGTPIHFQRLMVTKDSSNIQLTVSSKTSQGWIGWMLFGIALTAGALLARQPRGWAAILVLMVGVWLAGSLGSQLVHSLVERAWIALEISLALWLLINLESLLSRLPARTRRPEPMPEAVEAIEISETNE